MPEQLTSRKQPADAKPYDEIKMSTAAAKTLRLVFPLWQGGNNPPYYLGCKLLEWLAPAPSGPVEEVPVPPPDGQALVEDNKLVGRQVVLEQLRSARALIDKHLPDRLVTLGGDCLVDLVPFAYLNEHYDGDLAVIWIDTHPDIMTTEQFNHAHAMVLSTLMGNGDPELVKNVPRHVEPKNILFVGVHDPTTWEASEIQRLGLQVVGPDALAESGSQPVLNWVKATGKKHLAVHVDLDVLDPAHFRALLFAEPGISTDKWAGTAEGELTIPQLVKVVSDLSAVEAKIVGIGFAEHVPWDALALKNMLAKLPLLGT